MIARIRKLLDKLRAHPTVNKKPAYEEIFTEVGFSYRLLKIVEVGAKVDYDNRDNPKLKDYGFFTYDEAVIFANQGEELHELVSEFGLSFVTDGKIGFLTLDRSVGYGILPQCFIPMTCFYHYPDSTETVIADFTKTENGGLIKIIESKEQLFEYLNKNYSQ